MLWLLCQLGEMSSQPDWKAIERDPDFVALKFAKRKFIVPAVSFFMTYYLSLPILVGYFPDFMKEPVFGKVNWAYLHALSQFIMTWGLAWAFVRTAKKWDAMNAALLAKHGYK